MNIIKTVVGFVTGGSPYLLLVVGLTASLAAGTLAWSVRGWKANSDIAEVQGSYDEYKLQVLGDANGASQTALRTIQADLRNLTRLQLQAQQKQQLQSQVSKELLERLAQNANANDPVCPATRDYLDGLRKLQAARTSH